MFLTFRELTEQGARVKGKCDSLKIEKRGIFLPCAFICFSDA
jgi:hypothetical protein